MKLNPRELSRLLDKPDPTIAAVLFYGSDTMRVALKRQEYLENLLGPNAEQEMRLTRFSGDDILKDLNNTIAIKVDVEGLELLVLKGLTNLIKKNRIFLQIEIFDQELVKTSSFLEEHNFKLITKGTFTHQDNVKDYFYINF